MLPHSSLSTLHSSLFTNYDRHTDFNPFTLKA